MEGQRLFQSVFPFLCSSHDEGRYYVGVLGGIPAVHSDDMAQLSDKQLGPPIIDGHVGAFGGRVAFRNVLVPQFFSIFDIDSVDVTHARDEAGVVLHILL